MGATDLDAVATLTAVPAASPALAKEPRRVTRASRHGANCSGTVTVADEALSPEPSVSESVAAELVTPSAVAEDAGGAAATNTDAGGAAAANTDAGGAATATNTDAGGAAATTTDAGGAAATNTDAVTSPNTAVAPTVASPAGGLDDRPQPTHNDAAKTVEPASPAANQDAAAPITAPPTDGANIPATPIGEASEALEPTAPCDDVEPEVHGIDSDAASPPKRVKVDDVVDGAQTPADADAAADPARP